MPSCRDTSGGKTCCKACVHWHPKGYPSRCRYVHNIGCDGEEFEGECGVCSDYKGASVEWSDETYLRDCPRCGTKAENKAQLTCPKCGERFFPYGRKCKVTMDTVPMREAPGAELEFFGSKER